MSDQDVFAEPVTTPAETTTTPAEVTVTNETPDTAKDAKDLLASIVDDSGRQKYTSVEQALAALQHSQKHISTLETEREADRNRIEELSKVASRVDTVENTVKELLTRNEDPVDQTPTPVFDESKVAELVKQTLEADKQAQQVAVNKKLVNDALIEKYGSKANEIFHNKAKELGTTGAELEKLSAEKPSIVISLFKTGVEKDTAPNTTSIHVPVNTDSDDVSPPKPTKSLLSGATSQDQTEFMKEIKRRVYARNGITE